MVVQITLTLTDLIAGAAIILPLGCAAVYWAIRIAVRYEVTALELRIAQQYVPVLTCRQIREECERHRHEAARARP